MDATVPPAFVPTRAEDSGSSARALAGELGLELKEEPELRSLVLEGDEGRILFVDGTRTVTVAGRRLESSETLWFAGGDVPLLREDAVRIAAAWHEVEARSAAKSRDAALAPVLPPVAHIRPGNANAVGEKEWGVPLQRTWEGILVHHSATPGGNLEKFDRYHREVNGWLMIGYDFVICNGDGGPDGLIQTSERWKRQIQGAHAGPGLKRYNDHWVGICLVGDFNQSRPTKEQLRSLRRLVAYLEDRCGIPESNVRFHRDVRDTDCPGRLFPAGEFQRDDPRAK